MFRSAYVRLAGNWFREIRVIWLVDITPRELDRFAHYAPGSRR